MICTEASLYTVIGIIMANSFILIAYTWKLLTTTYMQLPSNFRPPYNIASTIFKDQRTLPKRVKEWVGILTCLWFGCIFLGISIFMNTLALVGISGRIIADLYIGSFAEQNYNEARVGLMIAIIFFASGIISVGIARIYQFMVFTMRRGDSVLTFEK